MAFLDHRELKLIKGIGPVPGDTNSAEQQPVVVNLMDTNGGIALDGTNGAWSPQIPSVKPLWAENPANDGRTLIAGALNNVTETMRLTITGSDAATVYSNLRRLFVMRQAALDFWQTESQIDPVYLKWWANCGTGPQFALIYTMDIAAEFMNSERPTIQVTLTIEREFGWRGIPPGANPKLWSLSNAGAIPNTSNVNLSTAGAHLLSATFNNRTEWVSSAYAAKLTENRVTIPAASIPGDMPALLEYFVNGGVIGAGNALYVGKRTAPISGIARSGSTALTNLVFNIADGSISAPLTTQADTGASQAASGSRLRGRVTFASAGVYYGAMQYTYNADRQLMRGRYLVFLRCRASVASTPINIRLNMFIGVGNETYTTTPALLNSAATGGTGNTTDWDLLYLGLLPVTQSERAMVGQDGRGIFVYGNSFSVGDMTLTLEASKVSGTGDLYLNDLILIPIDEGAVQMSNINLSDGSIYDTTCYFNRGKSDIDTVVCSLINQQYRGQLQGGSITLTPGIDNHLYFLSYSSGNTSQIVSGGSFTVYLNIVPRWSGIRDA